MKTCYKCEKDFDAFTTTVQKKLELMLKEEKAYQLRD